MVNPWVEHVRKYAKDNNISYMCAITEAKASYEKSDPKARKAEKETELFKSNVSNQYKKFKKLVADNNDESDLKSIKARFSKLNDRMQEAIKTRDENLYNKLVEGVKPMLSKEEQKEVDKERRAANREADKEAKLLEKEKLKLQKQREKEQDKERAKEQRKKSKDLKK